MKKDAQNEEAKKPKKMFVMPGGGNDSFAQMMRQQMGGSGNSGPRQIDAGTKQKYKENSSNQAAAFKDKIESQKTKDHANKQFNAPAAKKDDEEVFGNWRTGNFGEAKKSKPAEQTNGGGNKQKKNKNNGLDMMPLMDEPGMQQRQKTTCANAHLLIFE